MGSTTHLITGLCVFLGGACDPTTWRHDVAMPLLDGAGVPYFNPQVSDWSAEFEKEVEAPAKRNATHHIFVIDSQTRAIASALEATEYAMKRPRGTVFLVVNDIEDGLVIKGQTITGRELQDLNRARAYVRAMARDNDVPIYASVEDAIAGVIAAMKHT